MSWFRWRSSPPSEPQPPDAGGDDAGSDDTGDDEDDDIEGIDVDDLLEVVQDLAQQATDVDVPLLQAEIADQLRDLGVAPMPPERFLEWSASLDAAGWQKLQIASSLLPSLWLEDRIRDRTKLDLYGALRLVLDGEAQVGVELLATSDVRAEELVRRLAMALSLPIADETPEQSREELEKLDYNALLAKVDSAKLSAEERMARLRKLQEGQDNLRRRGKW